MDAGAGELLLRSIPHVMCASIRRDVVWVVQLIWMLLPRCLELCLMMLDLVGMWVLAVRMVLLAFPSVL